MMPQVSSIVLTASGRPMTNSQNVTVSVFTRCDSNDNHVERYRDDGRELFDQRSVVFDGRYTLLVESPCLT